MKTTELSEITKKMNIASNLLSREQSLQIEKTSDLVAQIVENNSLAKVVADINEIFEKSTKAMLEPIVSLSEMANQIATTYTKSMGEQINKVLETFSLRPVLERLKEFSDEYDIAEEGAIKCMQKYKWFVTANMSPRLIFEVYKLSQKKGNMTKEINKLFEDFLFGNNYEGLDNLLVEWKEWIDPARYKIIKDTFSVIKSTPKSVNITNVVLPTLIVQAEGLLKDKLDFWNWGRKKSAYTELKRHYKMEDRKGLPERLQKLTDDIVINYLFQKSEVGVPLEKAFQFNRHKIIHGEIKRYGRRNYLVRIILLIDYFATLKDL